jgi:hypothetical protein
MEGYRGRGEGDGERDKLNPKKQIAFPSGKRYATQGCNVNRSDLDNYV